MATPKAVRQKRNTTPPNNRRHAEVMTILRYLFIAAALLSLVVTFDKAAIDPIKSAWGIFTPEIKMLIAFIVGRSSRSG